MTFLLAHPVYQGWLQRWSHESLSNNTLNLPSRTLHDVDCVWNVMAHAQKPDFVFLRNGRVHLNRRGRQFSRLLAVEVCASAVVMLDTPCSEVVWSILATHSVRQFPLHFPSRASSCTTTFQLESTTSSSSGFPNKQHFLALVTETSECATPVQRSALLLPYVGLG